MQRTSENSFSIAALLVSFMLFFGGAGNADARCILPPTGDLEGGPFVMPMRTVLANTVMAAYQKPYALNFEVWRPQGMPAGWYSTFDGYAVAQVAPNRWVYGRSGLDGCLIPTDVLVGSVVPMRVPHLARVRAPWICNDFIRSPAFQRVREFRCDSMGILEDPLAPIVLAWSSRRPGVWVWLGDNWKKISPSSGRYTWEALRARRCWIMERLRENEFFWSCGDVGDLANLARSWGLIWRGTLPVNALGGYRQEEGGDGGRGGGGVAQSRSSSPAPSPDPGSQWDVGGDDGAAPGGGGGGGWDTGGR